jgi:hypothetical protein
MYAIISSQFSYHFLVRMVYSNEKKIHHPFTALKNTISLAVSKYFENF